MTKLVYLSLLFLFANTLLAQKRIDELKKETTYIDSTYIQDYSNQLSVKFVSIKKSNTVDIFENFTKKNITYQPNEIFGYGIGVGYKWFGMDLVFKMPFTQGDVEKYGKTKSFDIQSNVYTRRYVMDFNVQAYQGYYGANPQNYDPAFDKADPIYPIRADLKTANIGASALYIFNHSKFSYRSAFVFNERQIKSAGSFLAGAYINIYSLHADSTLIPASIRPQANPDADFRDVSYFNMGISGGYGHTFVVFKRFYFSLSLVIGLGSEIEKQIEKNDIPSKDDRRLGTQVIGRSAFGYNGKKFFTGVSLVGVNSGGRDSKDPYLERSVNNFKFFIGARLNPPKFLK